MTNSLKQGGKNQAFYIIPVFSVHCSVEGNIEKYSAKLSSI